MQFTLARQPLSHQLSSPSVHLGSLLPEDLSLKPYQARVLDSSVVFRPDRTENLSKTHPKRCVGDFAADQLHCRAPHSHCPHLWCDDPAKPGEVLDLSQSYESIQR